MPSGVALGLVTAASWGGADFFARFATRSVGTPRALLGMQAWGALAGVVNTAAMFALYRAFEIGKMAVVAPISASYPALTVILSMFSGEKLSSYRAVGILAAVVGAILVAAGEKSLQAPVPSAGTSPLPASALPSPGSGS